MTHIWVKNTNILEARREIARPKVGVKGFYRIQVFKLDGTCKKDTGYFENLITDIGMDRIATSSWGSYCYVGSGSSDPAVTDTSMETFVASTSTNQSQTYAGSGSPDYYGYTRNVYRFEAGVAAGNLSEVGVGWNSTSTSGIFSRAKILDEEGNPTTITVLSDEYLDVTYELRCYSSQEDTTYTVDISGVTYTCVSRAAYAGTTNSALYYVTYYLFYLSNNAYGYNGSLGEISGAPSGTSSAAASASYASYVSGTYTNQATITFGLNNGNVSGGISALKHSGSRPVNCSQISFSPAIPKTSASTLVLVLEDSYARA